MTSYNIDMKTIRGSLFVISPLIILMELIKQDGLVHININFQGVVVLLLNELNYHLMQARTSVSLQHATMLK